MEAFIEGLQLGFQALHSNFTVWEFLRVYLVDDDFGPGLLLSHGSDLLVKLFHLGSDGVYVGGEFFLGEFVEGGKGQIASAVLLDAGYDKVGRGFVVAEDIVDCIAHVVDVCFLVDFVAKSMYNDGSFCALGWCRWGFFLLIAFSCDLCPGVFVSWCVRLCSWLGLLLSLLGGLRLLRWGSLLLMGTAIVWGLSIWAIARFSGSWSGGVSLLSPHSLDLLFHPVLSLFEVCVLAFEGSDSVV